MLMLAVAGLAFSNVLITTTAANDAKKELAAVYAKIDAAIKNKDVKTLASLLAEDYEKEVEGKKLNRAETIAEMKENFEAIKSIDSIKTTIDKIQHVEGNEIVDYTQTGKATVKGEGGKDQTVSVTSKGRDWWVKDDDGDWMCVSSEKLD
jgi:ketosteroid isomerase-like protein